MKILVSDDSKTTLTLISAALEKLGHEVIAANNGLQAIEMFQEQQPDLIILDVMMEGVDGFDCAKKIRALENEDWVPIIFLSGSVDDESIVKGIDAGGDDYLTKPFSEITLAAKIKAMQRIAKMRRKLLTVQQQLALLSSTDALTQLYNRFQFDKKIKEQIAHADHHHCTFALFFIDLDKFKSVNDNLGHHVGDLLLNESAQRLKSCISSEDFLARIGGDEFAIIISEINGQVRTTEVAEKIILSLSTPFHIEGETINISCSIGIAFYPFPEANLVRTLQHADMAMYYAKKKGRNNYQYFSPDIINCSNEAGYVK